MVRTKNRDAPFVRMGNAGGVERDLARDSAVVDGKPCEITSSVQDDSLECYLIPGSLVMHDVVPYQFDVYHITYSARKMGPTNISTLHACMLLTLVCFSVVPRTGANHLTFIDMSSHDPPRTF